MRKKNMYSYEACGTTVGVNVDESFPITLLNDVMGGLRGNSMTPSIVLDISHCDGIWIGKVGNEIAFRVDENYSLVLNSMSTIINSIVFKLNDVLFLHSGAVMKDGRAILIIGASGAGKTSIVAGLLKKGYEYLSDEVVPLKTMEKTVLPFRRNLSIREGTMHALGLAMDTGTKFHTLDDEVVNFISSEVLNPCISSDFGTPHLLFFPRFDSSRSTYLKRIDQKTALKRLIACSTNMGNLAAKGFIMLTELVAEVPSYEITFNNLDSALVEIEKLVLNS